MSDGARFTGGQFDLPCRHASPSITISITPTRGTASRSRRLELILITPQCKSRIRRLCDTQRGGTPALLGLLLGDSEYHYRRQIYLIVANASPNDPFPISSPIANPGSADFRQARYKSQIHRA